MEIITIRNKDNTKEFMVSTGIDGQNRNIFILFVNDERAAFYTANELVSFIQGKGMRSITIAIKKALIKSGYKVTEKINRC